MVRRDPVLSKNRAGGSSAAPSAARRKRRRAQQQGGASLKAVLPKGRVRPPRFRILPLTMVMAFLLFGVKVTEVYQGGRQLQIMLQPAYAQEENEQQAAPQQAAAQQADEGGQDAQPPAAQAGADGAPKPPPASDPSEEQAQKMAKLQEENDDILGRNRDFSQVEIDILQSLAERRRELEERDRELDLKEKLLEATELRINDKIAEAKRLEEEVSELLKKYSTQEESHIRSLVKIYENMKPKSAALIFNELELPVLLEVIDQMSERKVAPVLASMDPLKAKEVTSDLAELRKLKPVSAPNAAP